MLHTTLKLCKKNDACKDGYKTLKKSLSKDHKETDLIPLTHIIESNGLNDALWALRATVEDSDYLSRAFAIWCARECLQYWEKEYPGDDKLKNCIDVAEQYNNGETDIEDLYIARSAAESAESATRAAAWSAESAAWSAAWSAESAAGAAAESVAESAARAAARAAAWSAESAAWSAAGAARAAAGAARSAESAAWSARAAAGLEQKEQFIKMLEQHK